MKKASSNSNLTKLNRLIESVCGTYARVARRLGVHRTYVSRVARGERKSENIERALMAEYQKLDLSPEPPLD